MPVQKEDNRAVTVTEDRLRQRVNLPGTPDDPFKGPAASRLIVAEENPPVDKPFRFRSQIVFCLVSCFHEEGK